MSSRFAFPVIRWPSLACAAALVALLPLAAYGQTSDGDNGWWGSPAVGLGPIILRSQSPLSLLRLTPTPLQPVTVPEGTWQIGAVANWNNYFDLDPKGRYLIDAESVGITVGAAYGVSDRFDVTVGIPVSYRGGGVLDGFVEHFERWVGQVNEDRFLYPRDQYDVRIVRPDGSVFEKTNVDAGWGIEDPVFGARYQIAEGTERTPAVLVSSGVKIPVGSEGSVRSSGGVDVFLGFSLGQRLGRFNVYASVAGMRYGTTNVAGIDLNRHQWSLFNGLEYRKSERTSWLLQGIITSAGTKNFGGFADSTYEMTIGFKRLVRPDLLFEASVLENLFIFNNSPDVGFHVGLIKRVSRR